MRELQDLEFIRHPSIAPMLMIFLCHNRAPITHLRTLEATVETQAKSLKAAEKDVID